jgi:hypothetical protein
LHAKTPHDVPAGIVHDAPLHVDAGYDVPFVHCAGAHAAPGQPPQWFGSLFGLMHVPPQSTGVAGGQPDVHV